ncbi:erythromycin esterase family protein [Streptomyces sp. 8K308]|uniref:erythromycin esterase family protein n=1 Tax=Streptomyces sp. 8K308 TaxID=2530388 RepID=UPI001044C855|nr:erythromycin esterase family protein [Streptomyces sp. 8K308]TDC24021.1 erythromycin esterase family protein [Streptomyces sp. 8K308]
MHTHPTSTDAAWTFAEETEAGSAVARFLAARATTPRVLALGEPIHGQEIFPRLRNHVFRHLVEHHGYRSIAIESDAEAGLLVDAFVTEGAGTLDEALERGISHGWGTSPANRELLAWLREVNRDRPAGDRVRFYGFDGSVEISEAASPRHALTALHDFLAARLDPATLAHDLETIDRLLGSDERWSDPQAALDPAHSVGSAPEVARLRLIADDLTTLLAAQSPRLAAASSPDEWWRARLHGRTATWLLRYHMAMADPSLDRMERLVRLRDAWMAENLAAVREREDRRGPTLVFANNVHLKRDESRMTLHWPGPLDGRELRWWSAGALLAGRLGAEYAFLASAFGAALHLGLDVPPPDTVEGLLAAHPAPGLVIDTARLPAPAAELRPRPAGDPLHGYFPLDPAELAGADGVLFVDGLPRGR